MNSDAELNLLGMYTCCFSTALYHATHTQPCQAGAAVVPALSPATMTGPRPLPRSSVTDCRARATPRVSGVLTLIMMARRLGPDAPHDTGRKEQHSTAQHRQVSRRSHYQPGDTAPQYQCGEGLAR